MKRIVTLVLSICLASALFGGDDPLPSWNEGCTKSSILAFIDAVTNPGTADFIPEDERFATFDQDGTLWVEHPIYTQSVYALDTIKELAKTQPELRVTEPFKSIVDDNFNAILNFTRPDWEKIVILTNSGMTVDAFTAHVKNWISTAKHPRWNRRYPELAYVPMRELMEFLKTNGFKTYIVTGGAQDFVRVYSKEAFGVPPEQVIGTAGVTQFQENADGCPLMIKEPKLLFYDNYDGKPEAIHLIIGRRPLAAFGNSNGDQQMLEYTCGSNSRRLTMIVLHDDAVREYAYGPANGLPDTKVGTLSQNVYDKVMQRGGLIISMKNDWKKIFSFETVCQETPQSKE